MKKSFKRKVVDLTVKCKYVKVGKKKRGSGGRSPSHLGEKKISDRLGKGFKL